MAMMQKNEKYFLNPHISEGSKEAFESGQENSQYNVTLTVSV